MTSFGGFFIEDDVAFLITENSPLNHETAPESVSETEFLTFEEMRFLGCLTISWPEEHGILSLYPLPHHIDISLALNSPRDDLLAAARRHVRLVQDFWDVMGVVLPPIGGGPNYRRRSNKADECLVGRLCDKVLPSDKLMIRGLAALVRADMLSTRREFLEPAIGQGVRQ